MVTVSCKNCGKKFFAKPSHISYGFAKFCSRKCAYFAALKGRNVQCNECGKKVYRAPRMLERSKSEKYFCDKRCQTLWRNKMYTGEKHANYKHGKASYRSLLARAGVKKYCRLCKSKDERVLAVHHIDENRRNNVIENLMYLCHNCHHLIHHFPGERDKLMVPMV